MSANDALVRIPVSNELLEDILFKKANNQKCILCYKDLSGIDFGYQSLRHVQLQHSLLIGADLSGCFHVTPAQVGGADLSFASLPESLEKALTERLDYLRELNKKIGTMETVLLAGLIVMVLVAYATDDVSFFTNSGTVALPIVNFPLSPIGFVSVAPLLPIALYAWVHFHIQQYWKTLANLPAIFPDGTPLPRKGTAWLGAGRVEKYFPVLQQEDKRDPLQKTGAQVLVFTLYAVTPVMIASVGWRCLALHNFALAIWHTLLTWLCIILGYIFYTGASRCFVLMNHHVRSRRSELHSWNTLNAIIFVICPLLLLAVAHNETFGWRRFSQNPWPTINYDLRNPRNANFIGKDVSKPKEGWVAPDALDILSKLTNKPFKSSASRTDETIRETIRKQKVNFAQVKPALLDKVDLNNVYANEANFVNAHMQGAKLSRSSLVRTNFQNALMSGAEFYNANLSSANLQLSDISETNFKEAIMDDSKIEFAFAVRSHFENAKITRSNFRYARLQRSFFNDATLEGNDFSYSNMTSAVMRRVKGGCFPIYVNPIRDYLYDKVLDGPDGKLTALYFGNTVEINTTYLYSGEKIETNDGHNIFVGVNNFQGAVLSNVDLADASLRCCLLNYAILNADLRNADMRGSHLFGTDLRYAINIDTAYLEGVIYDATTRWPEGLLIGPNRLNDPALYKYTGIALPEEYRSSLKGEGYNIPQTARMLIRKPK